MTGYASSALCVFSLHSLFIIIGMKGDVVCERIIEAYHFALDDPFRATTNNKGVMNGMDAISIATGQDWRAGEASAHAYAAKDGYAVDHLISRYMWWDRIFNILCSAYGVHIFCELAGSVYWRGGKGLFNC